MRILKDFCAIDFETMTPKRSSACSIGMAKVRDGEIVETFHSLIKPIPDDSKWTNTFVHGITPEMVKDAPTFDLIWDKVHSLIEDFPLVAHNSSFDKSVFSNLLNYYGLDNPDSYEFQCTYKLSGLKLNLACEKYNVRLDNHHEALSDAVACANLYLAISENDWERFIEVEFNRLSSKKNKPDRIFGKLSEDEIINRHNYFYDKNVVITGVFINYPVRNELKKLLQKYGAEIKGNISKSVDIVIVGDEPGPSKLKKIEDFNNSGSNIELIYEERLVKLLNDIEKGNSGLKEDPCEKKEFFESDKFVSKPESSNPFKNKKVLINGSFSHFIDHNIIKDILNKLKAKEVSYNNCKDIDIMLYGKDPDDDITMAIEEIMEAGRNIKIYFDDDFYNYVLNNHNHLLNPQKENYLIKDLSSSNDYSSELNILDKKYNYNDSQDGEKDYTGWGGYHNIHFFPQDFNEWYYNESFKDMDGGKDYLQGKSIVITGKFAYFSNQKILKEKLELCGAIIQKDVITSTNLLLYGLEATQSKIEKANRYIKKGFNIEIIDEYELKKYLAPQPTILQCEQYVLSEMEKDKRKRKPRGNIVVTYFPRDYFQGFYPEEDIIDKSTVFYHKRTYIHGSFNKFPNSFQLHKLLQKLGTNTETALNSKVDIVIMGKEPDLTPDEYKLTIKKINSETRGQEIIILKEEDVIEILKNSNLSDHML